MNKFLGITFELVSDEETITAASPNSLHHAVTLPHHHFIQIVSIHNAFPKKGTSYQSQGCAWLSRGTIFRFLVNYNLNRFYRSRVDYVQLIHIVRNKIS